VEENFNVTFLLITDSLEKAKVLDLGINVIEIPGLDQKYHSKFIKKMETTDLGSTSDALNEDAIYKSTFLTDPALTKIL